MSAWQDDFLDELAERVASKLADRMPESGGASSPWMTTEEAIAYTRVAEGTFREWMAAGRIPSHGGRRRLFHRDEVDAALLGYARGSNVTPMRKAS